MRHALSGPRAKVAAAWVLAGAAWLASGDAQAQTVVAPDAVEVQRYRPVTPYGRGFGLEGAEPLPHLAWALALDVNHAQNPVLVQALPGGEFKLLERQLTADFLAAVGLGSRFELALALPVVLSQAGEQPPNVGAIPSGGLGDARLTLRARLLGPSPRGFALAASLTAASPLGTSTGLVNDGGLGLEPRLVGEWRLRRYAAGARVGYRYRSDATLLGNDLGNALTFAAGGQVRLGRALRVIGEVEGATPLDDFGQRRRTPVEGIVGARRQFGRAFAAAGVGVGLVSGYGAPAWRALLSAGFATVGPDSDRDGVFDTDDQCIDEPEDRDGFEDADGCPDPDNDEDGLLDAVDACPLEAEDEDGFEDEDGCPDKDNDNDGIADHADKCPNDPETVNQYEDEDGCPDDVTSDKDGDGLVDVDDACPEDPEDKDGFEDTDGCPDPDNDRDGVPDAQDKCPSEPETINGNQDDDGCPDEGAPQVRIGEKELEVLKPVFFDLNRARVRHKFHPLLDQIALTLKAHPEIGRCAVEGHTDDSGPEDWNQKLSVMRAQAVVDYLAKKGVDPKRLFPIGFGEAKPWADNDSDENRAQNRRVVFHIEGQAPPAPQPKRKRPPAADATGAQKARGSAVIKQAAAPSKAGALPLAEAPEAPSLPDEPPAAPVRKTEPSEDEILQGKTLRDLVRLPRK